MACKWAHPVATLPAMNGTLSQINAFATNQTLYLRITLGWTGRLWPLAVFRTLFVHRWGEICPWPSIVHLDFEGDICR
eukprot:6205524-Pleurochrysis_carterae.AAC.1